MSGTSLSCVWVVVPPLPGEVDAESEAGARQRRDAARAFWQQNAERIRADVASAEASGARGTPTFFVGSARHIGPYDAESLIAELEASRSAAAPSGVVGGP